MVVPAFMVMFFLGLKCRLVDGWTGGGGTSRRGSRQLKRGNVPNAEMRKCQLARNKLQTIMLYVGWNSDKM